MIYENINGIYRPVNTVISGGGVNHQVNSRYENLNGITKIVFENDKKIIIVKDGVVSNNIMCYASVWNDRLQSITNPDGVVLTSGSGYAVMKTTKDIVGRFVSSFTGNSALSICILFEKGKDGDKYKLYTDLYGCSVRFQYSGSGAKEYFTAITPAERNSYYVGTNSTSYTVSEAVQIKSYTRDITLDSVLVNGKSYHRIDMMYLSCWKNNSSVYNLNIYNGGYVNIKNMYLVKE